MLLDAQPVSGSVTNGASTPLVFHFAVGTSGTVTFATGAVPTSIAVGDAGNGVSSAQVSGTAAFATETLGGPGALNSVLSFSGTQSVPYAIALQLTSAFAPAVDQICANVSATAFRTVSSDAGAATALADLVDELTGAVGVICISDASNTSAASQVSVTLAKAGATPTTSLIAAALTPDGGTVGTAAFAFKLTGVPATTVYDGHTLYPNGSLPITVSQALASYTVQPTGGALTAIATGAGGTFALTLSPLGTTPAGVCPSGQLWCSGACITSPTGTCTCGSGLTFCGSPSSGGTCTNTASDPNNCGTCGRACATGHSCAGGACL
jgi:hypothetical protein